MSTTTLIRNYLVKRAITGNQFFSAYKGSKEYEEVVTSIKGATKRAEMYSLQLVPVKQRYNSAPNGIEFRIYNKSGRKVFEIYLTEEQKETILGVI